MSFKNIFGSKQNVEEENEVVIPFNIEIPWDSGAPEVHVFSSEYKKFLTYYSYGDSEDSSKLVLIEFERCYIYKFGSPNDEALGGHSLYNKGLKFYSAHKVENSKWIEELKSINKVHPRYNPDFYNGLNHYIFCFKDSTFECLAESYKYEVLDCTMKELYLTIYEKMN